MIAMYASLSKPYSGAVPEVDESRVQPLQDSLAMSRHVQDRLIARGIDAIVVQRLFSAGLALESARGLMGDHLLAGRIQELISKVELMIRDLRTARFDHHQPDSPSGGRLD